MPADAEHASEIRPRDAALLFLAYAAFVLAIYAPALSGGFISDDHLYLVSHPYVSDPSAARLLAIWDPTGDAMLELVNYAPVHLMLSAAERALFADAFAAYHVVNLVLHALNATLLALLVGVAGAPFAAAALAGALFAAHPANVEAVAWISQLKTVGALAFGLSSLLLLPRRPLLATIAFALALLTKFHAVALLPMAVAIAWVRDGRPAAGRLWLGAAGFGLASVLCAIPQFTAFSAGGEIGPTIDDPLVKLRTIAAHGTRYLVMAATSWGTSAFHEPAPAASWLDRRWLAAVPAGALLGGRALVTLWQRKEEAVFWVGAGAAFAPISQLFPFFYPIADRYLYFILPGLLGGATLLVSGWRLRWLSRAALVIGVAVALFFMARANARASLWRADEVPLLVDAAAQYPSGSSAYYLRAVNAAQRGDPVTAVQHLRAAESVRPLSMVRSLSVDSRLAPLKGHPHFLDFIRDFARHRIEVAREHGYDSPAWLRSLAPAHVALGEYDEAIAVLERAIRGADERLRPQLLAELQGVRAAKRAAARTSAD